MADSNDVESLKSQRRTNEGKQSDIKDDIGDLDDKIKRLRDAYDTIDGQKEDAKDYKKAINRLPNAYSDSWKGENADFAYQSCEKQGGLSDSCQSYIDNVDDIEEAINDEITRLKNLRSDKWGILQGLVEAWNNLTNKIRNAVN